MIPLLSILCMAVSALAAIVLPIALFFLLRRKYQLKTVPVFLGAAAFIVFALILERALHSVVLRPDADGNVALLARPVLYCLYGIFAAGIFEETGRFAAMHLLKKRYGEHGTGLAYGIGHGGAEAILLVGLTAVGNLVLSVALNVRPGILGDELPSAAVLALRDTAPAMFLVAGLERTAALALHIALSLLVWRAVRGRKPWLYPVAILLHAAADLPAALYQAGLVRGLASTELFVLIAAILTCVLTEILLKHTRERDASENL